MLVPPGAPPGTPHRLLLTADTVVAGVHADLDLTSLADLGWKAVAAAVSDVAAMGGDALWALVTVAGPPGTDLSELYGGIAAAAEECECAVVGGDLVNGPTLCVTVAVTGHTDGDPVRRSGARPGDAIWVTGPLGAAAAGLRLLRAGARPARPARSARPTGPTGPGPAAPASAEAAAVRAHARPIARLAEGRAARRAGATAMIDISDGLTADLDHLAEASGVGLRLEAVPVHPAATMAEALEGGEDYELAFCAPAHAAPALTGSVPDAFAGLRAPIRIGTCTAEPGERTIGGQPFTPSGWQHAWRWEAGR